MEHKDDAAGIDEYIAGFPEATQDVLRKVRAAIKETLPGAIERMAYRMPTFWMGHNVIHYAAYEHHIGLYPTPHGVEAFQAELAAYKQGKGSVQIPLDKPIPYGLIARIAAFRAEELEREKSKKAR